MLPNIFACLESLDSDHELLNLRHHSTTYDHFDVHEARLEHELKVLVIISSIRHQIFICYLKYRFSLVL